MLSLALTNFYAYSMEPTDDNPMSMQYPKKYEKFKWKVPYGTIKSEFNVSNESITIITIKKTMKKIFWDDPYQTTLITTIQTVDGNRILCAETIAYSFAGGQESDTAWINGMPILDSKIDGNLIYYTLSDNHGLKIGDTVTMTIDWHRRLRLMRLHFAAELILEIVTQKYHLEKVGAHIAEHKARIDFKSNTNISSLLPAILTEYNEIITSDRIIEKGYSDIANQRRFWKIDGFAQVPCGGTHVRSTREVGFVTLKREHPGKSIERIEIRLISNDTLDT